MLTTGPLAVRRIATILVTAAFSAIVGWGRAPAATMSEAQPTRQAAPNSTSSLTGNVWLVARDRVAAGRLSVYKNRSFCGRSVPNETLLVSKGGGVRNAVVLLHSLDRFTRVPPGRLVLDNIKCAFAPHVQVATVGSELLLKNSDPILHTVHARLGQQTLFNVGLPRGREINKILEKPGIVRINCDVLHTWMSAVVVVTATRYFAVTDEQGFFAIDHLPSGNYEMEVWHETLGRKTNTLSVTEGGRLSLNAVFGSATRNNAE
jgi:hypothetical protein